MARSFRVDFTKGMSAVVDPRLLGDGYAVFVDNADLQAFAASSYRAPVFRMDIPTGTVHAFEYRGKWHFSSERRHWAAEFIGKQERLYYTESGYAPGSGKIPMKVIDGTEARLGTPRPAAAATVSTDVVASPPAFMVVMGTLGSALVAGSVTYRLGYRTKDGLIPAGEAITIVVEANRCATITWGVTTLPDVTHIVIYGRDSGKEQILDEVTPDVTSFIDNGSMSPHGEFASNLDTADVFFYFHTYLRKINGHLDESGPSPRSRQIDQGKVCKITRNPDLEGLFDGSASITGAPSYATAITHTIIGARYRSSGGRRIITTATDHGLTAGAEVGIRPITSGYIDPNTSKHVYAASVFTTDLAAPTITAFGPGITTAPVQTPGVLLKAKVTAFRGAGWDTLNPGSSGGVPAESLPSAEVQWTTTAAKALLQWNFPTGDADGFHVYLNDLWLATVPASTLFLEFSASVGGLFSVPTINRSRTRAFYISEDPGLLWDSGAAGSYGLYGVMSTAVETKIGQPAHGLVKGNVLSFSGYLELNGFHAVSRVGNADEFYVKALTQFDDLTGVSRAYKLTNPTSQGIDQWALYVQRGATGGIALQQGVYPITQTEVIDYKPVQALSVTCDSSYLAATSEGDVLIEFNPWPPGARCLTLHNNILWGIVDNSVVWSPVNRPDAQPKAYRRDFPFPPTAITPYAGALIVLLPNGVGRFDGTDPANVSFSMTAARDGCNAPNSVQHTAAGLMYLGPRGLMAFQAELNTSIPITDGKIEASIFSGASSSGQATSWPIWWIPTRNSTAWAKCTRNLPSADGAQRERLIDETLPQSGIQEDIRSFYWRGRYYLYFTGTTYGNHGTIVVDTARRNEGGYPIFHIGLRPTHAHVTDRDQAFVLLTHA